MVTFSIHDPLGVFMFQSLENDHIWSLSRQDLHSVGYRTSSKHRLFPTWVVKLTCPKLPTFLCHPIYVVRLAALHVQESDERWCLLRALVISPQRVWRVWEPFGEKMPWKNECCGWCCLVVLLVISATYWETRVLCLDSSKFSQGFYVNVDLQPLNKKGSRKNYFEFKLLFNKLILEVVLK